MSVARHTVYNVAGTLVPSLVALVSVPLYLTNIGVERYGVLSICWLLLGYFGIFDLGLGRAVSQRLATFGEGKDQDASDLFWSALFTSIGIALAGSCLMIPAGYWALSLIKFENAQVATELPGAIPWLAATLPITLVSSIFSGALVGRARFGFLNLFEGLSNAMTIIAPLVFAWAFGPRLEYLVLASLCSRLVFAFFLLWVCRSAVPLHRPRGVSWQVVRSLLVYGGWVSVTGIVGPIMAAWDRFAVGMVLGAAAISVYVIAFTLVTRLMVIPAALSRALFPKIAAATGEAAQALSAQSVLALSAVLTALSLGLIALIQPFMILWIGPALADTGARLVYILLPGIWMNGFAQIAVILLQGRGQPNIAAKIHLAEVIPYLALLYVGMHLFGVEGAALAWALRSGIDALLLFRWAEGGLAPLRQIILPTIVVCAAGAAALILQPWPVLQLIVLLPLAAGGCLYGWWVLSRRLKMRIPGIPWGR